MHLDHSNYLVLTKFDKHEMPTLCFFELRDDAKVNDEPAFQILRAELLIDCDEDSITVLTNEALRDSSVYEKPMFARLASPPLLIKIPLDQLLKEQKIKLESVKAEFAYRLISSYDQMLFYRTTSLNYKFVEAVLTGDNQGLALRFYGR